MASSTLSVGKNVGFFPWGMHKMESKMGCVKWLEGEEETKLKAAELRKGHVRGVEELNVLEKMDGGFFSAIVLVCGGAETLT